MVKSVHRNLSVACCIFVLMLVAEISFAQEKNPTVYPYGGVPDSSRKIPVVSFDFPSKYIVPFSFNAAFFGGAHFNSRASFEHSRFNNDANFWNAHFDSIANFLFTHFTDITNFDHAHFETNAYWGGAQFASMVSFNNAKFDSLAIFEGTGFWGEADFRSARFNRLVLERTIIAGVFRVGSDIWSDKVQKFDCTRTIFLPNARLVLHDLVELNIQPEKFQYISFEDNLDYFLKKDIIENLKSKSFPNDKSAQFELDYIFTKSTMYQKQIGEYKENRWYEIGKWPKWFINTIYYWTMGLGYRPFRLIWWMLAATIIYTAIFAKKIPGRINAYISNPDTNSTREEKKEVRLSLWETLLNCAYFSAMVFFTFRLKRDILTFFDAKEKRLIVGEWVVGFLVYVAFLTLSKSGSILHNLKELFVG